MKMFNKNKERALNEKKQLDEQQLTAKQKQELNKRTREHFDKKKHFEKDRVSFYKVLSKVGFIVGGVGVLVGLAGIFTAASLAPLKTVEPYVIRINNTTGFTDIAKPISDAETTYGEELDKYWLARFVMERESYDWQLIQNSFDSVKLMSSDSVFSEYNNYITSPVSPVTLLKDYKKIKVRILSVSIINDIGQVRFSKQVVNSSGEPDDTIPKTFWVANIAFDYKHTIKLEREREINPLGFEVISYRVDPENIVLNSK